MIQLKIETGPGLAHMMTFNCPHCARVLLSYGYIAATCKYCNYLLPPIDLLQTKQSERLHYHLYGINKLRII